MAGRILEEDIVELRERSDIVEVISGQTQLKRAGQTFKGLCPFHQEKSPSFTVDPSKRLYHCFGCGAGGDVFTFLIATEGLSFSEAAERLATRLGMTLRTESGAAPASGGVRRRLLDANKMAADYFADLLNTSPTAEAARRYVESRGFSREDAKAWGLGFAPSGWDVLYRRLLAAKFTPEQIVDAGLALVTEGGEHRDRFRGRLIFPTMDLAGDVVGFGARALGDEQPKYLNSPETVLYHKGRLLYGLDKAKRQMVSADQAVVTEGYTDVIALHKVGVATAVATNGTALGEEHFKIIRRFCSRVILAFDADAAGSFASERGFGLDEKVGLQVLVALLPPGKDPADVAIGEGAEAVQAILAGAVPLMAFMLESELARHRVDTPEAKARALRALAAIVAREPRRIVRGEYAFWMARQLGVDERQVQQEISELGAHDQSGTAPRERARMPGHVRLEREALSMLIGSPRLMARNRQWLSEDHFTIAEHRVLFRALAARPDEAAEAGRAAAILDALPDVEARRLAAELALAPLTNQAEDEVFLRLGKLLIERQIATLRARLGRLDPKVDQAEIASLFEELMRLEEQRRRFDDG